MFATDKSGKKFAPKAPVRRAAPAPAAPARRLSTVSQNQPSTAHVSQERDIIESVPPPSASPAPEQPPVTEPAPIPGSTAKPAPKSATAIPAPRPKRKASVSVPAVQASTKHSEISSSASEYSKSPRTLPTEHQIIPSIESDIELPQPTTITGEGQPVEAVETSIGVSAQPEPTPESQASTTGPVTVNSKRVGVTKTRREITTLATPPSTQTVVSTIERRDVSATPVAASTPEPSPASAKGKKRKTPNGESETPKPRRIRRKRREQTPEGAETVEILPNVIKMSELCKDLKTGRKSKRETELRRLEIEEHERKLKAQEEGLNAPAAATNTAEAEAHKEDRLPPPNPQAGPVMRIVNGEIVLDAASLEVDRHADAARSAGDLEDVVENQLTRKINQSTYSKRTKTAAWDEELTDLFYRGLSMFGTDFMVISKLFPGRSRHQIKLKFNNEERRDPQRIKDALFGPRESMDIATYSQLTKEVYEDPKVVQQELDEEKRRIEEQHEKEKKLQEEMMRNPTATGTDKNVEDKAKGTPGQSKRNNRKQNMKNQGGGTEEVLGTIAGIPVT